MPKTAFATTSATEYPICSPAVAVTPEIPNILIMDTNLHLDDLILLSQGA